MNEARRQLMKLMQTGSWSLKEAKAHGRLIAKLPAGERQMWELFNDFVPELLGLPHLVFDRTAAAFEAVRSVTGRPFGLWPEHPPSASVESGETTAATSATTADAFWTTLRLWGTHAGQIALARRLNDIDEVLSWSIVIPCTGFRDEARSTLEQVAEQIKRSGRTAPSRTILLRRLIAGGDALAYSAVDLSNREHLACVVMVVGDQGTRDCRSCCTASQKD